MQNKYRTGENEQGTNQWKDRGRDGTTTETKRNLFMVIVATRMMAQGVKFLYV